MSDLRYNQAKFRIYAGPAESVLKMFEQKYSRQHERIYVKLQHVYLLLLKEHKAFHCDIINLRTFTRFGCRFH